MLDWPALLLAALLGWLAACLVGVVASVLRTDVGQRESRETGRYDIVAEAEWIALNARRRKAGTEWHS